VDILDMLEKLNYKRCAHSIPTKNWKEHTLAAVSVRVALVVSTHAADLKIVKEQRWHGQDAQRPCRTRRPPSFPSRNIYYDREKVITH